MTNIAVDTPPGLFERLTSCGLLGALPRIDRAAGDLPSPGVGQEPVPPEHQDLAALANDHHAGGIGASNDFVVGVRTVRLLDVINPQRHPPTRIHLAQRAVRDPLAGPARWVRGGVRRVMCAVHFVRPYSSGVERRDSDRIRHVLFEIVRTDGDPGALDRLTSPDDRRQLVELARHHRVLGPTLRLLAERDDLPLDVEQVCRDHRDASAAARLTAARAIGRLDELLDTPFLLVKGPAIAAQWYGHPADRDFGDLDVLVHRHDFRRAFERLEAAGATPLLRNWQGFSDAQVAEIPLEFDAAEIDLHWDLVGLGEPRRQIRFDQQALFARSLPIRIGSHDIRTLDPTDTLIHVCVNAGLDGARRLSNIVDVDRIVRSGVDVDELVQRASATGARALCAAVLERAHVVLHTPLPDGVLDMLEPWTGWLAMTRLNRRLPRTTVSLTRGGVESGLLTTAGRDRRRDTTGTLVRSLGRAVAERAGRNPRTQEGGALDWSLPSDPDSRDRYFDWVDTRSPIARRRLRSAAALEGALAAHEPRSSPLIGAGRSLDLYGSACRADLWTTDDGTVLAALAWNRWSIGRTTGYVMVFDAAAADDVARRIDRLGITELGGFDRDVEYIRPHLGRWKASEPATAVTVPPGFIWGKSEGPTRVATLDDLDRIEELLWFHSPHGFQNRWLLRRRAIRAINELTLVACDPDGRIVGVGVRQSTTASYHCWDFGVVEPGSREQGYSWHLVAAGADIAIAAHVGAVGFVINSNPMPIPDDVKIDETYFLVDLRPPRRFKGEVRLRRAIDRVLSWNTETVEYQEPARRSPGADDDRVSSTRTQAWWSKRLGPERD